MVPNEFVPFVLLVIFIYIAIKIHLSRGGLE